MASPQSITLKSLGSFKTSSESANRLSCRLWPLMSNQRVFEKRARLQIRMDATERAALKFIKFENFKAG